MVNLKMTKGEQTYCKNECLGALPSFPGTVFLDARIELAEEPEAPTVSLGEKVIWLKDTGIEVGIMKWIGRIPLVCSDWTAGVEFENPIGHGNGELNGRRYFRGKEGHVLFMPVIGLLKHEDYANGKAEIATGECTEGSSKQENFSLISDPPITNKVENLVTLPDDKGRSSEDGYSDLIEKRTISSFLSRSLQRPRKRKNDKRPSAVTVDNAQDNKWKNSRKANLNLDLSNPIVDDEWPVIESDSEIDYKGGVHVLMSCFTLGTSYRRRKTSTTEYVENKTGILLTQTSEDCNQKVFAAEQPIIQDDKILSTSLSNVSSEIAYCNNSTQELEKNSVKYRKRRGKKKAPPPPPPPYSPVPTSSSTCLIPNTDVDELPDIIGKLYAFSNTSRENKKERDASSSVSVLHKGRYARVIEEKPLKNEVIASEQTVSCSNSVIVKQKSVKRKSAKKRPAPQPPPRTQTIHTVNVGQSEQNKTNNWYNGSNFHQTQHCKLLTVSRMYFENLNTNSAQYSFTPMCLNNLHPPFPRCNCVTCNQGNSTVFLPHVVCPVLPKETDSSNITVLGYCNVEKAGGTALMQRHNAFIQPNNNNIAIPSPSTVNFIRCLHCDELSTNIHGKCCAAEGIAKDNSEEQCYNVMCSHCKNLHSHKREKAITNYKIQKQGKENCYCSKCYLNNRNASVRLPLSNMSKDERFNGKMSHASGTNFCSCTRQAENSDDDDERNSENYLAGKEVSIVANSLEIDEILPRRKTKSQYHVPKNKPFDKNDEFNDIQDLVRSRQTTVKDFIAAFNYLTQKTNSDLDISSTDKIQTIHSNNELAIEETSTENSFDLQSLPTKWRYSPISDKKSLPSKGSNKDLMALKGNKNKKVTFKKGTKPGSRSPVDSYSSTDINSEFNVQAKRCLPSISSNDITSKPLRHSVLMAHNHAYNQHLLEVSSKRHVSNQSGCSHRRKIVNNGNSSKETRAISNSDKRLNRSGQNIRHLGYRKMYRAPPAPGLAVVKEENNSSQNEAANNEGCEKKHKREGYSKEHMNNRSKSLDDKIWVSLYIEDKSSHKGLMPLLLSPAMTLRMLKVKLEAQFGYPRDLQRWILGKSFATDDDATLASYNVTEAGCPVFLYMTAKNLPQDYQSVSVIESTDQKQDTSTEDSDSDVTDSDSGTVILASDTEQESSESSGTKADVQVVASQYRLPRKKNDIPATSNQRNCKGDFKPKQQEEIIARDGMPSLLDNPFKPSRSKRHFVHNVRSSIRPNNPSQRNDSSNATYISETTKENYKHWVEIEEKDLISNLEPFECPVCFLNVPANAGVMLKDCLHLFCRECLSSAVYYAEEAIIKCPFINEEYSCDSHLQEREIKALVSPEVYERHLQRSIAAAESQAKNSFHCKSPDCPGWCLYEDKVNLFLCPVCGHLNCLTCQAIHEGRNCRQYQDELEFNSTTSDEAKKTKDYLDNMLKEGEAMRCPQCHIILMKKWGCDWLKCSVCLTEVCWVTKGRRWGPAGRGDASGGCRCGVNGVRCHPKCNYCH